MTQVALLCGFLLGIASVAVPATAQVIPPEEYLGYKVGSDYVLTTYQQAIGYLEKIAGETDRMVVRDMGPTSMGEEQKYLIISSSANMAELDRYREIAERMSLGRGVTEEEAERLAEEGRAIAWIDVGLHGVRLVHEECRH